MLGAAAWTETSTQCATSLLLNAVLACGHQRHVSPPKQKDEAAPHMCQHKTELSNAPEHRYLVESTSCERAAQQVHCIATQQNETPGHGQKTRVPRTEKVSRNVRDVQAAPSNSKNKLKQVMVLCNTEHAKNCSASRAQLA
jgi:hypothetical protein